MRKIIFVTLLCLWQTQGFAMNLPEFLKAVEQKHKSFQSLDASIEASEYRRVAGDSDLAPEVTFDAKSIIDKKEPNQLAQFGVTESRITQYSLGLSKRFQTGTRVGLSAVAAEFENKGLNPAAAAALPPGTFLDKYGTSSLGIAISQSLWKDFFGSSTRLRWKRESQIAAAEKGQYDLQKRQLLILAEATYWDYVYSQEDLNIQQTTLSRSRKIEQWTSHRVRDGISDRSDLLQTQALVAQRQMQLMSSQNAFQTAQKKIRDFLELENTETLPVIEGKISKARPVTALLDGSPKGKVVQIEAYVAALNAKAKEFSAESALDANRPDLVLSGAYNTNGYDSNMPNAVKEWEKTDKPTTVVGLNFKYTFGTNAKSSVTAAARKDALAAKLMSERKMLESESAWTELIRQNNELSKQVEAASTLSALQTERAKAQLKKFNQGRSITTDVVNAEQDAANAELNLTKLMSEQRKLEAQGRLFIVVEESL